MNAHRIPWDRSISGAELAALTEGSSNFKLIEPKELSGSEAVVRGDVRYLHFRSGMTMHCSDTLDLCSLKTQIVQEPGLSFFLFLQGAVDMRLGARSFRLGSPAASQNGQPLSGTVINCAEPDLLTRISERGRRVRKVAVTLPLEWFEAEGRDQATGRDTWRDFCERHLASTSWVPSSRIVSLAEQILRPPVHEGILHDLYIESRSLEIVGEALSCLLVDGSADRPELGTRDYERVRAIGEQLSQSHTMPSSIEEIARDAGMSSSSLQRHFRAAYGMSVFEFIRNAKLDQARRSLMQDGISVSEAAYQAGYSSAANFATAFKRRFGISPKHVRS